MNAGESQASGRSGLWSGYDAELQRLDDVFRRACEVRERDQVLDVGCGTGHTTRAAAEAARAGRALGVDVSSSAIEQARRRARADGPGNVEFECGDAQVSDFAGRRFDLAISRFGTMFFGDASSAFANIARALRPSGRLVMMVWQASERNEWDAAVRRALGDVGRPPAAGAFSLGDPALTSDVLTDAGFVDIAFADIREPVYYGPDVESALAWIGGFASTRQILARLDPDGVQDGLVRLRELVSAHVQEDGVWFGSRSWIVTARRAGTSDGDLTRDPSRPAHAGGARPPAVRRRLEG